MYNVQLTEKGLVSLVTSTCGVSILDVRLFDNILMIRYEIRDMESLYSLNCVTDTIASGIKQSLLCTQTATYISKDCLVIEFELSD